MNKILVVPCFNEFTRIKLDCFKHYPKASFVFVNDGSTDGTQQLLADFVGTEHHLINLLNNQGKAEAVRIGMLEAIKIFPNAEWIGFLDADLSTPLEQTDYMLSFHSLYIDRAPIIYGSRVQRLGATIHRKFLRHILGRFFVTYSSLMLNCNVYDSQCGAKLFKRELVAEIFANKFITNWLFDLEIIMRANQAGCSVLECPLQIWTEIKGSKLNLFRDGVRSLLEVIKIRKKYGKFISR